MSKRNRYSAWDGSQQPQIDPDEVMKALADDLIEYGDLRWAMRNLMSQGMQIPQGGYLQGLRDMMRELRERKQRQLKRFNLDSIFEGFRERLDEIIQMERDRIEEWKAGDDSGSEQATGSPSDAADNFSNSLLRDIAQRNERALDDLPDDIAAQINALEKFEFINPDAQKKFLELLNELRKAMTNTFFQDIENMVNNLSDGDIDRMKDMVKALNDMLVKQIAGEDPGFDEFMEEFGDMFVVQTNATI